MDLMNRKMYLDAPKVGVLEKKYLSNAIDSGYVSSVGPLVQQFEFNFSKFLNIEKAVSTQSGTSALHVCLRELNIGEGDEVIVPVLTFIATVNPVVYVGAEPIFADVDIKTWAISPEEIEKRITEKTKAIIPVHLYGNSCNMDAIVDIAKRYDISIIEDATESLGSRYNGEFTGTFGDFGCFSFNGNKIITTGGGGMIIGKDDKKIEHIRYLVDQARDEVEGYHHSEIGFNFRMTNIEAALGLAQIAELTLFLKKKEQLNAIYRERLKEVKSIDFQDEYEKGESSCWLTCAIFDRKININTLQRELRNKGIPTRRIFTPIIEFPPYKAYKQGEYSNSYDIYNRGLCLPSSLLNSEDDIRYVCDTIKSIL